MDDVCITARGPQEVNKLQESMAAFSLLTQLLQLHSSARLKLIYGSLHTTLCYFKERGFLHWELLPVFFHISFTLLRYRVPTGSMNIKMMEVMLTMVELTYRNDHINQIWTRMYLTLHQTFITLLLFFQSKQTWLCIQIKPMSFSSQYCLLLFYCTSAYNKNRSPSSMSG